MKIIKIELVENNVLTDIICDSCGKSCKTEYGMSHMNLETDWGYSSKKDGETWTAQICEECVDKHLGFIKFQKKNSFSNREIK